MRKRCDACKEQRKAESLSKASIRYRQANVPGFGLGSGGNQYGSDNSAWRGGISVYRQRFLRAAHRPIRCEICSDSLTDDEVVVHHRDEDRNNGSLNNLAGVCKGCHQNRLHATERDDVGRYTSRNKIGEKTGNPETGIRGEGQ